MRSYLATNINVVTWRHKFFCSFLSILCVAYSSFRLARRRTVTPELHKSNINQLSYALADVLIGQIMMKKRFYQITPASPFIIILLWSSLTLCLTACTSSEQPEYNAQLKAWIDSLDRDSRK